MKSIAQRYTTNLRDVMKANNILPFSQPALSFVPLNPDEVLRKKSLGSAMELCAEVSGLAVDKQISSQTGIDKGRWSRIKSGQEGIFWPQLKQFMDVCGNAAPLLWMLADYGYDIHSIRKTETETEKALRKANEQIAALTSILKGNL